MTGLRIRRGRRKKEADRRKDHLIQTRVDDNLQQVLKKEAKKRRLTVSHLLRNVLEETFGLVDGVLNDVDTIISDSIGLAQNVTRDAKKIARTALRKRAVPNDEETIGGPESDEFRDDPDSGEPDIVNKPPGLTPSPLDSIYAWNPVVLNQDARCSKCGGLIEKGRQGFAGLSDDPSLKRQWLCQACIKGNSGVFANGGGPS
ncbi:MAG: hypothetical protein M0036_17365 [Desulfobacteraceae bacterium]|nr:hypothetical protein [Desulfobacteraceae bacterium]